MYSFDNVNALPLDVWGTAHVLQTSPQAHLIISQFWRRGSCICQTRKGRPEVSFGRLRTQNIKIHLIYSFDNVNALPLDVWGTDHVLQTSPQAHLIISQFWGGGSCICQTRKGHPEVSSGRLRTIKISKFI